MTTASSAPRQTTADRVARVLGGLDAIFAAHDGPTRAEPFLRDALDEAESAGDDGATLVILNELVGFSRSQSQHDTALSAGRRALDLVAQAGLDGTDAHATTLVNAATASRAAGRTDEALSRFREALAVAEATMAPSDRRLAGLHNNLSLVHSDTGDHHAAKTALGRALAILESASDDPSTDLDVATTCSNLALVCFSLGEEAEAAALVDRAVATSRRGGHEEDAHFAATLAAVAEASFRARRFADAAAMYEAALGIVTECYGVATDQYAVTAANLAQAREAAGLAPAADRPTTPRPTTARAVTATAVPEGAHVPGLTLSRAYWEAHGRPMLEARYPGYLGRVAAGLVGHGSECYGFGDAISLDHDAGPGFCLWLTAEDHAEIGASLQADYDALPQTFRGMSVRAGVSMSRGGERRVGVFEIGDFYERLTGYRRAPSTAHEWLTLDEATLAAATNGAVFADPHGAFSAVRGSFTRMPRDVRWVLVSRRLGMVAQAGQYNLPRMLDRGEREAAWLSVAELARAAASLVFLLNGPSSAGYLPYYKWQTAALRRLSRRMGSRLPRVVDHLSEVLRLASAVCFGVGDPGSATDGSRRRLEALVEQICQEVVGELQARGVTRSDETFLEHQRRYVDALVEDPWLRTL